MAPVAVVSFGSISIHALHEESDLSERHGHYLSTFQSTLSMRRATRNVFDYNVWTPFQSTLSMRRATVWTDYINTVTIFQSTLSMRRATDGNTAISIDVIFQSTLSMRRATITARGNTKLDNISIHALHEESDRGQPQ